ncbi:MAG TPA: ATP-binding protein [Longimicrobiales bacterium]|nr:ATP-binding protein [Longimicrobiales bacterium]
MRVRLQLLLPLTISFLVGLGFLLAALTVGDAVRGAAPGEAPAEATRIVVLWGVVVVVATLVVARWIARMIVVPLSRTREAAQRLTDPEGAPEDDSPLAEIQDVVRGISRAAGELRDRHARELRERQALATLVEAVTEGIIHVDQGGRIVRVNGAGRRLLRLPAEAVGRTIASMVRNTDLRQVLESRPGVTAAGGTEVVLDDRRLLVSATPLEDGGAVVTFVDLTDLRRLEEIRRDFVANASHELKTPLTSIRGYSETLLAGQLAPAEQRQFLDTIARNAERLQRIVDDLLDLSRLESGRWQPELARVEVADVAASSWEAFEERARTRRVAWEIEVDDDAAVTADRRTLEQVFTNLYDNALRYTPAGGRIRVTVRPEATTEPPSDRVPRRAPGAGQGAWVLVEVADTGSGIPRDALPRIFERFYRVDPARSRAEGGTGLGLSIVKHMMENMGGTVTAESEFGKGTIIRLWLPRPA